MLLLNTITKLLNNIMSTQEHIRKILKEEVGLIPLIRRRISPNHLEEEFSESLDSASGVMYRLFKNNNDIMNIERFTYMVTSMLIDSIHYEIHSTTPENSQWYDKVFNSLKDYYKDRIDSRYNLLQNLIDNTI